MTCNDNLYKLLIEAVLRSPVLFFDQTPTGRIINRFSNDISVMDNVVLPCIQDVFDIFFITLILIITILINSPILIITCSILIILLAYFMKFSKPVLFECRNLDLRHKTPIVTVLKTTISGILPLRVFG
jgi:ATP-binding cassette, subfamily C (CFTR/MRP), member 4